MEEQGSERAGDDVYEKAKASKFHFKSGSKRRSKQHRSADEEKSPDEEESTERSSKRHRSYKYDDERSSKRESKRRHRHKHHSSHSDRHPTSTLDGAYYDPDNQHRESLYDGIHAETTDPTTAFRESLFDALADDEGAAYWEGVYGQPVHIYPDTKPGPNGTLERMNEEEYADYVRTKMWEKSHQHIVEERAAREEARRKRKAQQNKADEAIDRDEAERDSIRKRMEESLRRGEERKRTKEAEAAWHTYLSKWADLKKTPPLPSSSDENPTSTPHPRTLIPWPVLSGNPAHIDKPEIERFLKASPAWKQDPVALLKTERVRWHPDKLQQRFGRLVDQETMALITAVFQVVDRLWGERR
ncbi:hypothetical protein IAQ61_007272 [Plenodomus lingam]|uniref:uncharacterized protein n=1 Tax=Leptosphaeria maculans TaxID=5022 RepID=UPI00331A64FA|nr:hypothetical protein IAQ61_007272 [Plenodomus lingam]